MKQRFCEEAPVWPKNLGHTLKGDMALISNGRKTHVIEDGGTPHTHESARRWICR